MGRLEHAHRRGVLSATASSIVLTALSVVGGPPTANAPDDWPRVSRVQLRRTADKKRGLKVMELGSTSSSTDQVKLLVDRAVAEYSAEDLDTADDILLS